MELVDRVPKIPSQEHPNGNAVCNQYVVLGLARFKASPEGVEECRDSVEDITRGLAVRESVIEGAKFMPF